MDIDENDIRVLATQIPKILIESSFTLLKTYPKASIALCTLFFSYIFVPSILWFFIYTIPFIVLITGITIQTYISINKGRHARKHDKDGKSPTTAQSAEDAKNANKKYNAKHGQSVRRRRAKVIFAESKQEGVEEKETVSSTNFSCDLVDKSALIKDTPKEIQEVKMNLVNDLVQSSPSIVSQDFRSRFNSYMRSRTFGGSSTNIKGISSENTEAEGDGMSVQWTEDDQKNLTDLGLSEIERNRRLESLIARRRAHKVLSFQLRRTMMNMDDNNSPSDMLYSIMIPNKINPLSPRTGHFTPISAPTGMVVHNPFDLPYEPHEEKPNLSGDSFHKEFLGTHPKDMHERSSSGDMNHETTQEVSETLEKVECQLGEKDTEKKVEQDRSQEAECDDKVAITDKNIRDQDSEQGPNLDDEVKTKSVVIDEDYNGRLSYSSSSEEDEPISRLDKEKILKSLSSPNPRNLHIQRGGRRIDDILLNYGSYQTEKGKRTECFYYPYDAMHHTPSHSIASDLQVEVSEFGSPPRLSDANISSPDDSRSLCDDTNLEKEIPESEDMWITSSQLPKADENESRSREIRQVSEEDNIGVGFSRTKEESKIPERVNAPNSSNPHPNFVSESKVPRYGHEQSTPSSPNSSHDSKPENLPSHEKQITGTSTTDHLSNSDCQNPQVPSLPPSNISSPNVQARSTGNGKKIVQESDEVIGCSRSPEKSRVEVEHPFKDNDETEKKATVGANLIHNGGTSKNVDDESPFPHNTMNNRIHGEPHNSASGSRLNVPFDGEAQHFQNTSKKGGRDLPDSSRARSKEGLNATTVNETTGESSQQTSTRDVKESSGESLQRMEIPDSLSTEGNYILESTTDTDDEASSIAIATSEPNQLVIQPNQALPVHELSTEQVPTASSTSSSPKSVLNPRFSGDQGHMSVISDVVQMGNQHSGGESSGSNSISPPSQTATPSVEDLTTHQSHERSTETVQVHTHTTNQETNHDTASSNQEETGTIHREGRL